MVTGKDICELIVNALIDIDPTINISSEDVWKSSPSGELFEIFEWYEMALYYFYEKYGK